MSKLIIDAQRYHELNLGCFREAEVQQAFATRSSLIYPGFVYLPFAARVVNSATGERSDPDFALVEREYRVWWVGEVESLDHSLQGHVLPQIRTFTGGDYNPSHAKEILRRAPDLDPVRVGLMVATQRPGVLVVVNRYRREWDDAVQSAGAKLAVFEVFRREGHSEYVFRINGHEPMPPGQVLSSLSIEPGMPRLLRVQTPSALPAHHGDRLAIEIDGALTSWVANIYHDKAWLNPVGGHSLAKDVRHTLLRTPDGTLRMERER